MKTPSMKSMLLSGVIGLASHAAYAQQSEIPLFLQQIGDMTYEGQVSGMDLYSMEGFEGLWLVSPDGRTAMAGTIFSNDGRDIGAVMTGRTAVTAFEYKGAKAEVSPISADVDPAAEGGSAPLLSGSELEEMEANVSRIGEDILGIETTSEPVIEEPSADSTSAAEVTKTAQGALEGLSPEDKEMLLQALVVMLQDVKSEAEFKATVEAWTEEVVRRHRNGEAIEHSAVDDDLTADIQQVESHISDTEEKVLPVLHEVEETVADRLLDEVRHEAFWFGIGNHEAPVVYAFIDPACPHCARAIVNIGDEISAGRLQLRVALAPVVSQSSPGFVASILNHAEPPIAFMEHEYARASGRRYLKDGKWEDLPGQLQGGLVGNIDMMKKYDIRGVPFFIFDTEDGARAVNGVPEVADFADAIRDPYLGTR